METRPLIAIFAKAPVAGRVKTRLAADLGDRTALGIYRQLLARTVARLTRPGWRTELWVTPDAAADEDGFWPVPLPREAQGTGDLGARMMRALDRATEEAPAIVVGTDIPDLDAAHVGAALSALDRAPIVFGPSCDGGFYLVGLRGPLPKGLFDGVPWSTLDTLARSIDSAAPLEPALIDTLDDLDDRAALDRHRGEANWDGLGAVSPFPICRSVAASNDFPEPDRQKGAVDVGSNASAERRMRVDDLEVAQEQDQKAEGIDRVGDPDGEGMAVDATARVRLSGDTAPTGRR